MKAKLFSQCAIFTFVALVASVSANAETIKMYNDTVQAGEPSPNVTIYSGYLGGGGGFETPSGLLMNYDTGAATGITVTLSAVNVAYSTGTMPNAGTDAYNVFNGIVNLDASASYNNSGLATSYTVTFTGLDPTKSYEFITTANRNSSSYAGDGSSSRWAKFSITGADTYTNASSSGVTVISPDVLEMNTGYNTVLGYIIAWSGITAADGSFTIVSQNVGAGGPGDANRTYLIQGFELIQFDNPVSSTPLPGALPLFVSGLGALGLLGWRRKKKAAALAA